jgi:hypothetical protein
MEVDRRSLMKGMLAGGALLALGTPPWALAGTPARRPGQCLLLLGSAGADDLFASGAGAAATGMTYQGLQTVKLNGGLLTDTGRVLLLLKQSRRARLIAVMDDAGAVIFLELARTAGVRLLSMGTHACSTDAASPLRHDWASTSPAHRAGGLLASHLLQRQGSFSITESVLQGPPEEGAWTSWSAPGFSSYRLTGPEPVHMHCSGLSFRDGSRLLGLDATEGWMSIPPQACRRDSVTWQSESWVESVGYVVMASALGVDTVRESCSERVFVHQSPNGEPMQTAGRFVSFVMDL